MRRFWLGLAAAGALSACSGGNPFVEDTSDTDGAGSGTSIVPAEVAGHVVSVRYDDSNDSLLITGISNDSTRYDRKPALDRNGYQAFTYQEHSQAPHATAYYREMEGGYAMVVATGNGPSGYYMSGSRFGTDGSFTAPVDGGGTPMGAVSYAGTYVGVLNVSGSGEDLLTPDPGTSPGLIPSQVAEVTGDAFILADFGADGGVDGRVYNRVITDSPGTAVPDLRLTPTAIASDGSFAGTVENDDGSVGDYAGVFTGDGATAVAGTLHVTDHIPAFSGSSPAVEEYGAIMIGKCGATSSHSDCPSDQ